MRVESPSKVVVVWRLEESKKLDGEQKLIEIVFRLAVNAPAGDATHLAMSADLASRARGVASGSGTIFHLSWTSHRKANEGSDKHENLLRVHGFKVW
jgi:hypothetical protein